MRRDVREDDIKEDDAGTKTSMADKFGAAAPPSREVRRGWGSTVAEWVVCWSRGGEDDWKSEGESEPVFNGLVSCRPSTTTTKHLKSSPITQITKHKSQRTS